MSEKRCNQCKVKFGGRKAGRTHGEETGHEWQPMVACLACHSAFKKQKLYKAHLPSCTARPMVPNRSLPCNTPIINILPPANVSGNLVDSGSDAVPVLPAALVDGSSTSLTKPFQSPPAVSSQTALAVADSTVHEERRPEAVEDITRRAVPVEHMSSSSQAPASDTAALPPSTPTERISGTNELLQEQQRGGLAGTPSVAAAPCTLFQKTDGETHFETRRTEGITVGHVKTLKPRWHCRACFAEPCDEPVATICGHIFCRNCIVDEIATGMSCPACKKVFLVKLDVQV